MLRALTARISFEQVATLAGANIVRERPEEGDYVDLSPEALAKDTFLSLLEG